MPTSQCVGLALASSGVASNPLAIAVSRREVFTGVNEHPLNMLANNAMTTTKADFLMGVETGGARLVSPSSLNNVVARCR